MDWSLNCCKADFVLYFYLLADFWIEQQWFIWQILPSVHTSVLEAQILESVNLVDLPDLIYLYLNDFAVLYSYPYTSAVVGLYGD